MPYIVFNGGHLFMVAVIAVIVYACCARREP
ncbi:membrane protein [Gordonia phage PokyPuppy]|nr:membrane protein [Gordonia phage PokyPuppy]